MFAHNAIGSIDSLLSVDSAHMASVAPGGYTLTSDPDSKLVRIVIRGFWIESLVTEFARDLLVEVRKLGDEDDRHVILCDLTGAIIQSQQTFEAFRQLVLNGPTRARKLALTADSSAIRMQARRFVALRGSVAMFASEEEAIAWLRDDDA